MKNHSLGPALGPLPLQSGIARIIRQGNGAAFNDRYESPICRFTRLEGCKG
jgi:hypothetical protein